MQTTAPKFFDLAGVPQRPDKVGHAVSNLKRAQLHGGLADLLKDQGHGPLLPIIVGDGQRDPFALFVNAHNDKLARLCLACHLGRVNHQELVDLAQDDFIKDFVHPDILPMNCGGSEREPPP